MFHFKEGMKPAAEEPMMPVDLDLRSAPADFLQMLRTVEAEIKANGGFAVGGQVSIDGNVPKLRTDFDVKMNRSPTYHFDDGWFISRRNPNPTEATLLAHSAQAEFKKPIRVEDQKVNLFLVSLHKVSDGKLVTISGKVVTEDNVPLPNATVTISVSFPGGYFGIGNRFDSKTTTDSQGHYAFSGFYPREYNLVATHADYCYCITNVREGDTQAEEIMQFKHRKVLLDIIYQPDGSEDFKNDNVIRRQVELRTENYVPLDTARNNDLRLVIMDGRLQFWHYMGSPNVYGHYDAGNVDFDSLNRIEHDRISRNSTPCELDHVYVVKTFENGNYAKFVVRKIEIVP